MGIEYTVAMQLQLPLPVPVRKPRPPLQEKNGVVYTRGWVVDLLLDLAGYTADANLVDLTAVEPAAGDGAFAVRMAERLVASCRRQRRPVLDCATALIVYELDATSAALARSAIRAALRALDVAEREAESLVGGWVHVGDYLADAPTLPPVDVAVGNPPYIRLEDMAVEDAAVYRAVYPTMKGRADLYVAFFEATLRGLRLGGVCAFICADRWMLNQYGAGLRRLVTAAYGVEAASVGAAALADALRATRAGSAKASQPSGLRAARVERWFQGADPWPCVSPERLALLQRLEREYRPLEDGATGTRVGIGVASGADEIYITADAEIVAPSRLLPLALASDTATGTLRWSGHYLVNPWDAEGLVDLSHYPRLADYYARHRRRIEGRNVGRRNPRHWYRTIDRVTPALLGQPKLYIPDIKGTIHPVLDTGHTYPHHNLYTVQSEVWDLAVLGGILMSEVGQFFVACYGVRMRKGYLRFQAQYLRRIRVPHPASIPADSAKGLTSAFHARDVATATALALDLYGIDAIPEEG